MTGSIPSELASNVRALSGLDGMQWIERLPITLSELEREWDITVHHPFTNAEYNYVAQALDRAGEPCVIKVAPPRNDRDHFGEARYLKVSAGYGAVKLLAHDPERMALLIERAIPGETLAHVFDGDKPSAVNPAIELLLTTSRTVPDDLSDIILLDDWFDGLRRYVGTKFPHAYAEKALAIYESLRDRSEFIGYLHGDFHPGNIVSATRSQFLLIDPKGMVGHLGYEIAVFLNNFHWWQDEAPDIRERLALAIAQFSEALALPSNELREWAYAQMVLSAWWTFDEMPTLYDNEVAKADIWDV